MARSNEVDKSALRLAISQHLALHGPTKWPDLMAKWPDISRATFFRYVKDVRDDMENTAAQRGGAELRTMQKRIRTNTTAPASEKKLKANLPATPSPAALMGMGQGVEDVFNFMAHFNELLSDTKMMRNASVSVGADGGEKLKNPMLMDKSVSRRLDLIETWLRSQDMIWNFERMQELYHAIITEVGKADADTQQAIIARVRMLNDQRGLTVNARLS